MQVAVGVYTFIVLHYFCTQDGCYSVLYWASMNKLGEDEENPYLEQEEFHELADQFLLAVRGGQFPSFDYIRRAVDLAEALADTIRTPRPDDTV